MIDDSIRWIGDVDQYLMFAKSLMSAMSSMLSGALKAKEFQIQYGQQIKIAFVSPPGLVKGIY